MKSIFLSRFTTRQLFIALVVLVTGLLTSPQAFSQSIEGGFNALQEGNKDSAYQNWLPLAIKGDPRAQFFLSTVYEKWAGGPEDRDNAKRWLTASANSGFIPAQYNLGNNYRIGKYGLQNNDKAIYWWRQAALQGFAEAQFQLGTIYYWGYRGRANLEESLFWFEKAANGGLVKAREAMLQARAGTLIRSKRDPINIPYNDPRIVSRLSQEIVYSKKTDMPPSVPVNKGGEISISVSDETQTSVMQNDIENDIKAIVSGISQEQDEETESTQSKMSDKDWVSQQPSENYTIQLFASGKMEHCEDYVKELHEKYQLVTNAHGFRLKRRKLCSVIHGSYSDRSIARSDIKQLPRKIRRGKPWVRSLGKLQKMAE